MHRLLMRRWLYGGVLVAVALSLPFAKTDAGAQAPDNYGWWWQLREPALPVDPRPLSPVQIPTVTIPTPAGVPEDGMYVEGAATEPQAIGAVTFVIPEGAVGATLTLVPAVPLTPTTEILLCPTNTSWQPAQGGRWDSRPLFTCSANAPKGVVPTDGSKITFTLGDLGKSQLIDVALVPAPNAVFRAIFNKPDKNALSVIGGDNKPTLSDTSGTASGVLGTSNESTSIGNALSDPAFIPTLTPFLDPSLTQAPIGQAPIINYDQSRPINPVLAAAPSQDTVGRFAIFGLLGIALLFNRFRSQPQREPKSLVNFGKHREVAE